MTIGRLPFSFGNSNWSMQKRIGSGAPVPTVSSGQ